MYDWIELSLNWRATRIKTTANDIIVIPNSVVAKAIVTNHRRLSDPYLCTVGLEIDHKVAHARVIETLEAAARGSPGLSSEGAPTAHATRFAGALIAYELVFPIDDFVVSDEVQSEVISRVAEALRGLGIRIGAAPGEVRILQDAGAGVEKGAVANRTPVSAGAVGPNTLATVSAAHTVLLPQRP
jgi:small-conductance mechanosensitive channel